MNSIVLQSTLPEPTAKNSKLGADHIFRSEGPENIATPGVQLRVGVGLTWPLMNLSSDLV